MKFREATFADIPGMHMVRLAVKENVLSHEGRVTEADYVEMLEEEHGKGWVCTVEERIAGFAIVDVMFHNVWALFILPEFEKQGIGKQLHKLMLDWSFRQQGLDSLWLSTAMGTRAEEFYERLGWKREGVTESGEVHFEMTKEMWVNN